MCATASPHACSTPNESPFSARVVAPSEGWGRGGLPTTVMARASWTTPPAGPRESVSPVDRPGFSLFAVPLLSWNAQKCVRCTRDTRSTYATSRENLPAYNEEYAKYFPSDKPARTTVLANLGSADLLVEISVTACIPY